MRVADDKSGGQWHAGGGDAMRDAHQLLDCRRGLEMEAGLWGRAGRTSGHNLRGDVRHMGWQTRQDRYDGSLPCPFDIRVRAAHKSKPHTNHRHTTLRPLPAATTADGPAAAIKASSQPLHRLNLSAWQAQPAAAALRQWAGQAP